MKKLVSLILAVLMLLTMTAALAEDGIEVHYNHTNVGAVGTIQAANSCVAWLSLNGGSMVYPPALRYAPDDFLTWAESSIAAGADGLLFFTAADTVMPSIVTMCEQSGVYYALTLRDIRDDEIKELVLSSPYFAGYSYEDEIANGYMIGEKCAELGYTQIAIVTTQKGDMAGDPREEGLLKACDEFGIELVAEVRGLTQASEGTTAAQSLLAAYPDLDCIISMASVASGSHDAIIAEIASQDTGCHYMSIDTPLDLIAAWESGVVDATLIPAGKGGLGFDVLITNIKLVNAINGNLIVDAEGNVVPTIFEGYMIDSMEEAQTYAEYLTNDKVRYITDEELAMFLPENNPDLSAEWIQEYVDNYDPMTQAYLGE